MFVWHIFFCVDVPRFALGLSFGASQEVVFKF